VSEDGLDSGIGSDDHSYHNPHSPLRDETDGDESSVLVTLSYKKNILFALACTFALNMLNLVHQIILC